MCSLLKSLQIVAVVGTVVFSSWAGSTEKTLSSHGMTIYGDLKYGQNFTHFEYANPQAPKEGKVVFSAIGTFDNLNPFILKGIAAAGTNLVFASLMKGSVDEPASQYCYVCEAIEVPEDRSWIAFTLRPEAKFHDGSSIMVEDVIFSFNILKEKGHPFFGQYYKDVLKAEKVGRHKVKFTFRHQNNRELPVIIGELPVLPRAYWKNRDFEKTTFDPLLGSGPYKIESVNPGRSITLVRVENWWGENLPVNQGRYNFDTLRYIYYRDITVALEAFKAGEYDIRFENSSKQWATGYDSPALRKGWFIKEELPDESPEGMQGFVYNTRKPVFQNRKVREALSHVFDFEWTNRALMYDAYVRTKSYFERSELAARGLPQGDELLILEKYRGRIPKEVFTREFEPPRTDGSGNNRENLRKALELLKEASWTIDKKTRKLVNPQFRSKRGELKPFEFEILLESPSFERIVLPFAANLEKIGITARVRTVDPSQYETRLRTFDFDMIVGGGGGQISPGNEQRAFWSSPSADQEGGLNYAGIKDPVVDELVELLISAPDRESLVARTRALDRVLVWGHYLIPQWHIPHHRVAYWNKFSRPAIKPKYGLDIYTWWVDPQKERLLEK